MHFVYQIISLDIKERELKLIAEEVHIIGNHCAKVDTAKDSVSVWSAIM